MSRWAWAAVIGCTEYEVSPEADVPAIGGGFDTSTLHTDRFRQPVPQIDVLFVIDDSQSMLDNQDELAGFYPRYLAQLRDSGLDYHVGVTTADVARGGQLLEVDGWRYLDRDTPQQREVFHGMVMMEILQSYPEKGLGATWLALSALIDDPNAGFRRDDAPLDVFLVSDEDDQTTPEDGITVQGVVEFLLGLETSGAAVSLSSIVHPLDCFCPDWGVHGDDDEPGALYLQVTEAVGGCPWISVQTIGSLFSPISGGGRPRFPRSSPSPTYRSWIPSWWRWSRTAPPRFRDSREATGTSILGATHCVFTLRYLPRAARFG